MIYYVIVEGAVTEKKLYPDWISFINPNLTEMDRLSALVPDSYYLQSGGGLPYYYKVISNAVDDMVRFPIIDRLVIIVDAEDIDHIKRKKKIVDYVAGLNKIVMSRIEVIVQDSCIESWALGNIAVQVRHPQNPDLKSFIKAYDTSILDPQLMPAFPAKELNRSQFAIAYLKRILAEKYKNLSYSKNNPTLLQNRQYFDRIVRRYTEKGHISCFGDFLRVFQ